MKTEVKPCTIGYISTPSGYEAIMVLARERKLLEPLHEANIFWNNVKSGLVDRNKMCNMFSECINQVLKEVIDDGK